MLPLPSLARPARNGRRGLARTSRPASPSAAGAVAHFSQIGCSPRALLGVQLQYSRRRIVAACAMAGGGDGGGGGAAAAAERWQTADGLADIGHIGHSGRAGGCAGAGWRQPGGLGTPSGATSQASPSACRRLNLSRIAHPRSRQHAHQTSMPSGVAVALRCSALLRAALLCSPDETTRMSFARMHSGSTRHPRTGTCLAALQFCYLTWACTAAAAADCE